MSPERQKSVLRQTFSAGVFGCSVCSPGGGFAPAHPGSRGDAEQIVGVGLKTFQEVMGSVSRHLLLSDGSIGAGSVRETVHRHVTPTQLMREGLPGHLNVSRAPTAETQLGSTQRN